MILGKILNSIRHCESNSYVLGNQVLPHNYPCSHAFFVSERHNLSRVPIKVHTAKYSLLAKAFRNGGRTGLWRWNPGLLTFFDVTKTSCLGYNRFCVSRISLEVLWLTKKTINEQVVGNKRPLLYLSKLNIELSDFEVKVRDGRYV